MEEFRGVPRKEFFKLRLQKARLADSSAGHVELDGVDDLACRGKWSQRPICMLDFGPLLADAAVRICFLTLNIGQGGLHEPRICEFLLPHLRSDARGQLLSFRIGFHPHEVPRCSHAVAEAK